jgi:hypothetical protein
MLSVFHQAQQPDEAQSHPNQSIHISGWLVHKKYSYCYLILNQNHVADVTSFYCQQCKKWHKLCGTIGNLNKHIKIHQRDDFQEERIVDDPTKFPIIEPKKELLMFLIRNNLSFNLVEDQGLSKISGISTTRQTTSEMAGQLSEEV